MNTVTSDLSGEEKQGCRTLKTMISGLLMNTGPFGSFPWTFLESKLWLPLATAGWSGFNFVCSNVGASSFSTFCNHTEKKSQSKNHWLEVQTKHI